MRTAFQDSFFKNCAKRKKIKIKIGRMKNEIVQKMTLYQNIKYIHLELLFDYRTMDVIPLLPSPIGCEAINRNM